MPVTFIGTSHIAQDSVDEIKKAFLEQDPDIVAVELDRQRLQALLSDQKPNYSPRMIGRIGLKGYLFAIIGSYFQRKLGRMVGVQPGSDMKQAVVLAKNNQKQVLLMDRNLQTTLKRFSKQLTRKEKWRFLGDLLFGKRRAKRMNIDLKKVPPRKLVTILLDELKGRYPTMHRVLVEERNEFMARRLAAASLQHSDSTILAVLGAGHLQGVQERYHQLLEEQAQHS
ncbi:TraB/GumN family protein [Candidatus Woesearchaeota archaeon]|nr:TraB/GumN family protein [Candidatus Woesearchaeota archaeon]